MIAAIPGPVMGPVPTTILFVYLAIVCLAIALGAWWSK